MLRCGEAASRTVSDNILIAMLLVGLMQEKCITVSAYVDYTDELSSVGIISLVYPAFVVVLVVEIQLRFLQDKSKIQISIT